MGKKEKPSAIVMTEGKREIIRKLLNAVAVAFPNWDAIFFALPNDGQNPPLLYRDAEKKFH